jgi:hypothetical protein
MTNILHEDLHTFMTTLVNNFTMITLVTRLPFILCLLRLIQWLNFQLILWLLCLPTLSVLPTLSEYTRNIPIRGHFLSGFRLSPCLRKSHSTKHQNWLALIISTPLKVLLYHVSLLHRNWP